MSAVLVLPYSAEWPLLFDAVRRELLPAFSPADIVVEHIGSTSVPGLAAKPVIDVLLGARTLAEIEARIAALAGLGYVYVPKYERELPMRRYFVKQPPDSLRIHVHGVEIGSRLWSEHLAFRDALRADPELRARYQSLKQDLAAEFADDKSAYTEAKGPFIRSVISSLASGDAAPIEVSSSASAMEHDSYYRPIFDFIAAIGIDIAEAPLAEDTFLPGIEIRAGGILVDPARLRWPGDLLHEAGHLAVLPAEVRKQVELDLVDGIETEYGGELEAMAWAYAAALELGVPAEVLIHEGGYNRNSQGLLQMYAFGVFPGLRGLCAAGMTAAPGFTPDCGPVRYPQMLKWLRD